MHVAMIVLHGLALFCMAIAFFMCTSVQLASDKDYSDR